MKKMKSLKSHNKIMVKRKDINTTILTIKNCPHCSSKNIIKYGKVNGVQRYKCKNNSCGKTFIEQYNSPFRYSKKFKYMWKEYYKLMEEGLTLSYLISLRDLK